MGILVLLVLVVVVIMGSIAVDRRFIRKGYLQSSGVAKSYAANQAICRSSFVPG